MKQRRKVFLRATSSITILTYAWRHGLLRLYIVYRSYYRNWHNLIILSIDCVALHVTTKCTSDSCCRCCLIEDARMREIKLTLMIISCLQCGWHIKHTLNGRRLDVCILLHWNENLLHCLQIYNIHEKILFYFSQPIRSFQN